MNEPSQKRIDAARANGAKSRGPITPEGKAISSRNATTHGLLSKVVCLEAESASAFEEYVSHYTHRLQPSDTVEMDLVEDMIAALWRLRRAWAIEKSLFDRAMSAKTGDTQLARLESAFGDLSDAPNLALLHRYETRLDLVFRRALHNLVLLRKLPVPNEPKTPFLCNNEEPVGQTIVSCGLSTAHPQDPAMSEPPASSPAPTDLGPIPPIPAPGLPAS
jgi:hypothetical protein